MNLLDPQYQRICCYHPCFHYKELDTRLKQSKFLAGEDYTIADIATFPWIARHEWHDIGLKNYNNLSRWYSEIASRPAVIKGFDLMKSGEEVPKV